VGVHAPHHTEVEQPLAVEVVEVAAGAHEEAPILLASRRGTDHS
jgi:DNA-binding protein Fis